MSLDSHSAVVVYDTSIKNQVAKSISHIHSHDKPVIKTIHHAVRVISIEAKLFVIRYGIIQAIHLPHVNWIIVITDSIYAAKKIFDPLVYLYQLQFVLISQDLREFFKKGNNYFIEFWDCLSNQRWYLHNIVDKEARKFNMLPIFSCKLLWGFSRKTKCKSILNFWKMTFQASDDKGHHFLDLQDEDSNPLEPSTANNGLWLKHFGHSNLLCARATRVIVNHTLIGKYRLRFFPREDFMCLCSKYPIKTRCHILYNCKKFNNLSQINYSLVVMLKLNGVSEVQYKKIMIIGDE